MPLYLILERGREMNRGIDGKQQVGREKKTMFSPRQITAELQTPSPKGTPMKNKQQERPPGQKHSSCVCLDDCLKLLFSSSQGQDQNFKLQHQLAGLEKEIQRQRNLKDTYKARLERMQEYLRYCLQVAQEHGFLDLISNNNHSPPPSRCNPQPTSRITLSNSHLEALREQAKLNGWYIDKDEIELHEQVGQGSTANIYRATWRGMEVAVKSIYPICFQPNKGGIEWFAQEIETLSRQRHPLVLRMMGACLNPPENAWVVTEFLAGTLTEWLHGHRERRAERVIPLPPLEERIEKGVEIAQAMQYLHEQKPKVVHRDLKPSNIFIDDGMHVRVADFGHARFLVEGERALTGETGTFVYMAPEVIRSEPYNEKCDVYSFGVILNELITGQHPYIDSSYGPTQIALEVGEGRLRPTLPNDEGKFEELINLIRRSWDENASVRPSSAVITCELKGILNKLSEEHVDQ